MKKTSKIIIGALLAAILLLGIGYAAVQNITLNITGTAAADPSQSDFKVMFSGTPTVSDEAYITASVTDDTNATINVSGFTTVGDQAIAEFTIQNASSDLSADLAVSVTNSNEEYFLLSSQIGKDSLISGEATTMTVTVELTKTPLAESVSSTIGVQLVATPVQPGEEGSSGTNNDFDQSPDLTLASLSNTEIIGDYIDMGNDVIGTESTADDWRIFYKDEDYMYVILADYLPNDNECITNAGLDTSDTYNVYSTESRDTLIDGLNDTIAWNSLANGFENISVTGAPTVELFGTSYVYSYNLTQEPPLVYDEISWTNFSLDTNVRNYDLYVPRQEAIDSTNGYWLASPKADNELDTLNINKSGKVSYYEYNITPNYAARPVLAIPVTYNYTYINGVIAIY